MPAFDRSEAGLGVARGLDAVAGAAALRRPQPHATAGSTASRVAVPRPRPDPLEVPRPDAAQHGDGGQVRQARGHSRPVQRVEQAEAVPADLDGVGVALPAGAGEAHVLDPAVVAFVPLGWCDRAQPPGGRDGERGQRRARRPAQQLEAVQVAHGGQHVRAVRALAPARLEQAALAGRIQHAGEQALGGIAAAQPAAELAEHAVVEARVGEVGGEQVLPVDPRPDGLGRLAVAQPLAELHERDESQPPGCVGRLAQRRV